MKRVFPSLLIIFLISLTSACSQIPQRNTYHPSAGSHQSSQGSSSQINRRNIPTTRQYSPSAQVSRKPIPNNRQYNPASQVARNQAPTVGYNPARQRMINIAASTIGIPYKWGGDSPQRGFDCSGLMTFVHKNALGMKIPRTTAQQRDQSRTVSYAQLQPGDMLFFKTGIKTNHVGVYIGNRKFIHAPSGGKRVKVASMDSSYWHKRFVKFGTFM